MTNQSFKELLDKYEAGQCSDEEKQLVHRWLELIEHTENQPKSENEWLEIKAKIWRNIDKVDGEDVVKPLWIRNITRYAVAASIVLAICLGMGWYFTQKPESPFSLNAFSPSLLQQINDTNSPLALQLEDGSLIQLAPGASLKYPKQFAQDSREVILKGNAFFDIAKNPQKPFLIQTGKTLTQVLGTSFNIKSDSKSNVEIEVITGKIQFSTLLNSISKKHSVELTPNHKAIYNSEKNDLKTGISDNPELLEVTNFKFQKTPIKEVLKTLEKAYGIELKIKNRSLLRCDFTGNLNQMGLFSQLDLICQSFSGSYSKSETQIIILAKGCE